MKTCLETEVLVVGAGPAGSSLAIWLAEKGVEAILVDRFHFPRRKACASCFSPKCLPYLERLGFRTDVEAGQRLQYLAVQSPNLSVRFETTQNPLGGFFYVFPREQFDMLLIEKARKCSVRLLTGWTAHALINENGWIRGALVGDKEIKAKITVIATGSNSRFLPQEYKKRMRTYQTLIGWYEGIPDLDPYTTDSYTGSWLMGTGWVFPESEHSANVGVMVHEEALRKSKRKLTWFFENYLGTSYVRRLLKGARRVGHILGSPIRYTHTPHGICGNGFLMVGEASLLTNPMTGEGISQALRSASLATDVLAGAINGKDYSERSLGVYNTRIQHCFRRNFYKARLLRWGLDQRTLFEAALAFVHFHHWSLDLVERKLHRIVF